MTASRRYVYAVVDAGRRLPEASTVGGGALEAIVSDGLAAVVSAYAGDWVPASRRNLEAHSTVVERLLPSGPVLPVRFGMLMQSDREIVEALLHPSAPALRRRLAGAAGKLEMRLRAAYRADVLPRDALRTDPAVRRLRERARPNDYRDAIRLGEAVAAAMGRIRHDDAAGLLAALSPEALAVERLPESSEDEALHAAFLLDRRERSAFERAVELVAATQVDRMEFELVGPLPLWDFVDVDVDVDVDAGDGRPVDHRRRPARTGGR